MAVCCTPSPFGTSGVSPGPITLGCAVIPILLPGRDKAVEQTPNQTKVRCSPFQASKERMRRKDAQNPYRLGFTWISSEQVDTPDLRSNLRLSGTRATDADPSHKHRRCRGAQSHSSRRPSAEFRVHVQSTHVSESPLKKKACFAQSSSGGRALGPPQRAKMPTQLTPDSRANGKRAFTRYSISSLAFCALSCSRRSRFAHGRSQQGKQASPPISFSSAVERPSREGGGAIVLAA
ncbi:hypothetical protein EJ06DRAFT_194349 [Trichodelitschia bisporula]|uniref:Uncharacterized protein n=1 Tax=Trichodelitschia bisporula TaxID=703511 RepID=A0A6G1I7U2_9PEZI|nr:hypothetical protein EJ06DRAFT_194349 [Trichodelitschia bisporula]